MLRFFITSILGAVVYTIGSIITPDQGVFGVLFAPIIGVIFTALVCGICLWPLRAGVKAMFPHSAARTQGFIAFAVVLLLLAALTTLMRESTLLGSRLGFFTFWLFYAAVVVSSWFWPEGDSRSI